MMAAASHLVIMCCDMDETRYVMAQLLTLAGLMGGTIEYSHIIRRRTRRHVKAGEHADTDDAVLRGLVRVFLSDE